MERNPVVASCPVCQETLKVVRLECESCGTSLEGNFALDRFSALDPEQRGFLEAFVRNRGSIKDVGVELGMSYPTVRSRLDGVIRAMGFEVPAQDHSTERRREILRELAEGKLGPDDAVRLLEEE